MRKVIPWLLAAACILSLTGCGRKPDFDDFAEYEDDFSAVVRVVLAHQLQRDDASPFIVDLRDGYLTVGDAVLSDESLVPAVTNVQIKGFSYIEVGEDYMIFWENETGYYGVLWSERPAHVIKRISGDSRPYLKSRKLAGKWYEVGALDSI